jgi:hypothetical protein
MTGEDAEATWALVGYTAQGSLDAGFGDAGVVLTPVGKRANAMALQPDGRVVVAGCDCPELAFYRGYESRSAFVAVRYHAGG